jgi:hypothetical protein
MKSTAAAAAMAIYIKQRIFLKFIYGKDNFFC